MEVRGPKIEINDEPFNCSLSIDGNEIDGLVGYSVEHKARGELLVTLTFSAGSLTVQGVNL